MRLKGKVALVIGASGGIGKAVVLRLNQEGAMVHAPTRKNLDLREPVSAWAFYPGIRFDIVVNCAGVGYGEDVFETNVAGPLKLFEWAALHMESTGSIILLTSIFGHRAGAGNAAAYQMSKAAVAQLVRNRAVYYAKFGIRVNAVCPAFIDDTALTERFHTDDKYSSFVLDGTPMKRMGRPSEVAAAVAFLASDDASYITGTEIAVDGGWLAQ